MTKRDIYYQDPELFRSQRVVDDMVDDIAFTFGVGRAELNITASPRGLMYGRLEITREDGRIEEGTSDPQGRLVPRIDNEEIINVSNVYWVLIIEKEATFRSLVESKIATEARRPGILVTAKGYPDLVTRAFLASLARRDLCLPMHVLTDYDPDGLSIAAIYATGSRALAHEGQRLMLPRLKWIGVKSDDVVSFMEKSVTTEVEDGARADNRSSSLEASQTQTGNSREVDVRPHDITSTDGHALLRLTDGNRKRARGMLVHYFSRAEAGRESWTEWDTWRRELQVMLMLNVKAEMQAVEQGSGGLRSWVEGKLGL